jgi:hypothetical protein
VDKDAAFARIIGFSMPVYEMLWDCAYCGTRRLLGQTHRFCPGCGAPQDPSRRYFPSDAEKVAAEDHVYVGADRVCEACGSAMSAQAAHCTQCGSDMQGAAEAKRVVDGAAPRGAGGPPATAAALIGSASPAAGGPLRPARGLGRGCLLVLALGAAGVVALIAGLLWRRPVTATVTGHSWERSIAVETFGPKSESGWCDGMPADAYGVSRSRRERSTRQVADGQDCQTVRIDQGDGTFREESRCSPRYRNEPVYADHCSYTVDRWSVSRTAKAAGDGLEPAPRWPDARLLRKGTCRGCEREGSRQETYVVHLKTGTGRTADCRVPEDRWRVMAPASRWRAQQGVVFRSLACGDLRPAS